MKSILVVIRLCRILPSVCLISSCIAWLFIWMPMLVWAGSPDETDRIIIKLKSSTKQKAMAFDFVLRLSHKAGVTLQNLPPSQSPSPNSHILVLPQRLPLSDVHEIVERLLDDPNVEYAEPDRWVYPNLVPNDPKYLEQWHYAANTDAVGGINLPDTWDITTGDKDLVIAVVDTGLLAHEDLVGRTIAGFDMISSQRIAADGDRRDDDPTDEGDWTSADECYSGSRATSSTWHGTHVAGTLGASSNNGIGVAGINWQSKIMPVRALGKCGGYMSDIAAAITWASGGQVTNVPDTLTPARVINLSLGGYGRCGRTEQRAINEAVANGVVVVVAAGNGNSNVANSTPANCENVIVVAAVNRYGARAYYSNQGSLVTLAAPGGDGSGGVLSTFNTGTTRASADTYRRMLGTSMATPHVAGVVSLLLSVNANLTLDEVRQVLIDTAQPFPSGTGRDCTQSQCGAGILDAYAAVLAVSANRPPFVDAGEDQRVNPRTLTSLEGVATDNDGSVVNYRWTQTDGETVNLLDSNTALAKFTAPTVAGVLRFVFTATDNNGVGGSDEIEVMVNAAPVAMAGDDQVVSPGVKVWLNGLNSDDDHGIARYAWVLQQGGSVQINNANTHTANFLAPFQSGSLSFELTVEDTDGLSSQSLTNVYVNVAPVARAGKDQLVNPQTAVTLDGSASDDTDGRIVAFRWSQLTGTAVAINNVRRARLPFIAPASGVLSFQLQVTDNFRFTHEDTVNVVVNVPPIARAGDDLVVNPGDTVVLSATESSDAENVIDQYRWTQIRGPAIVIQDATFVKAFLTVPTLGDDIEIQLTVTDSLELTDEDTLNIHINVAPVAVVGDQVIAPPNTLVTLDGSQSRDADGDIVAYRWALESELGNAGIELAPVDTEKLNFVTPATSGEWRFKLTVTDNGGLQNETWASVVVNQPPAVIMPDHLTINPGEQIVLDGSQSIDVDGSIVQFNWLQLSGPIMELAQADQASSTFTAPMATGRLTFQLTVMDNYGFMGSGLVSVTVNYPPVARASAEPIANVGDKVTLSAAASKDQDGDIVSYQWKQLAGSLVDLADDQAMITEFLMPDRLPDTADTLIFQLTVMDDLGLAAQQAISIAVNQTPVAQIKGVGLVNPGDSVTLDGSTSFDNEGQILTYQWTQLAGATVVLDDTSAPLMSFIVPTIESMPPVTLSEPLIFELMVTDHLGLQSAAQVSILLNQPPIAEAGSSITVSPGDWVVLNGVASEDNDNGIQRYHWEQIAGHPVNIDQVNNNTLEFNAPSQSGELSFQLTVYDELNLSATDEVSVVVNSAPVAIAGGDQNVSPTTEVGLDATQSYDRNDSIVSVQWVQIRGTPVVLTESTAWQPQFIAPRFADILLFEVIVTDQFGLQDRATTAVVVIESTLNVSAGEDIAVLPGVNVLLQASLPAERSQASVQYHWIQLSGVVVNLTTRKTAQLAFIAPHASGPLIFGLVAIANGIDAKGILIGVDTVHVTVINQMPVIDVAAQYTGVTNEPLLFDIGLVDDNQTQPIISASFLPQGAILDNQTQRFIWQYPVPGEYVVELMAIDAEDNNLAAKQSVNIQVISPGVLQFTHSRVNVVESDETVKLWIERVEGSDGQVSVRVMTTADSARSSDDYVEMQTDLTWETGDISVKSIDISILNDHSYEGLERFNVHLKDPKGNARLEGNNPAVVIIDDDDSAGEVRFSATQYWVNEDTTQVEVVIARSKGSEGEMSVMLQALSDTAIEGEDFIASQHILTWADGDSGIKKIAFSILNDQSIETEEQFVLQLSYADDERLSNIARAEVIIRDDDAMVDRLIEFDQTWYEAQEDIGFVSIILRRLIEVDQRLKVHYRVRSEEAEEAVDFAPTMGEFIWEAGDVANKSIIIPITDDGKGEGDELLTLELAMTVLNKPPPSVAGIQSANSLYNQTYNMSTQIVIKDNDPKCFIATAAYGSGMVTEVRYLRAFRDQYLLVNPVGQWFVNQYYIHSPPVADYLREHNGLRSVIRAGLQPLIALSQWLADESVYRQQTATKS